MPPGRYVFLATAVLAGCGPSAPPAREPAAADGGGGEPGDPVLDALARAETGSAAAALGVACSAGEATACSGAAALLRAVCADVGAADCAAVVEGLLRAASGSAEPGGGASVPSEGAECLGAGCTLASPNACTVLVDALRAAHAWPDVVGGIEASIYESACREERGPGSCAWALGALIAEWPLPATGGTSGTAALCLRGVVPACVLQWRSRGGIAGTAEAEAFLRENCERVGFDGCVAAAEALDGEVGESVTRAALAELCEDDMPAACVAAGSTAAALDALAGACAAGDEDACATLQRRGDEVAAPGWLVELARIRDAEIVLAFSSSGTPADSPSARGGCWILALPDPVLGAFANPLVSAGCSSEICTGVCGVVGCGTSCRSDPAAGQECAAGELRYRLEALRARCGQSPPP
ncbi:MAG: hypothetical protein HY907_15890 [Deltaproteobacteria bacterium]|nr:hypothetical protein [Deltaproteobacteria bacterium]